MDKVQLGNNTADYSYQAASGQASQKAQAENGVVYAGGLNLAEEDSADAIMQKAQKNAVRTLVSQMMKDLASEEDIAVHQEWHDLYQDDAMIYNAQDREMKASKEQLLETAGIREEDIDRSEYSLVLKSFNQPEKLTAKEKERLDAIPGETRTFLNLEAMMDEELLIDDDLKGLIMDEEA